MKGLAWGFIYTLLLFAFANAAGLDRLGKWTEFLDAIASLATVVGVLFAMIQVTSWRSQQNNLKSQNLAEEVVARLRNLKRDFSIIASAADERIGDTLTTFGSDGNTKEDEFAARALREVRRIQQAKKDFDEVFLLLERLKILDERIDLTPAHRISKALANAGDNICNLRFWAGRLKTPKDKDLSQRFKEDCDRAKKALAALSGEKDDDMREALEAIYAVVRTKMRLEGAKK